MKGKLFINGKDAFVQWGARMLQPSIDNLLLPANGKPFIENKNRADNGTNIRVINPRTDERTVVLSFDILGSDILDFQTKLNSFSDELRSGWLEIVVLDLRMAYILILDQFLTIKTDTGRNSGRLDVRFREPNPKEYRSITDENGNIVRVFNDTFNTQFN